MESRIPLPTDNIYKFYALFWLALLIASIAGFLYVQKSTNEMAFQAAVEYEELAAKTQPTPPEMKRKEMIERRVSIGIKDREFFNNSLSLLFGVGLCCTAFGFWKWQTVVQPKQDKLLDLQIQQTEQELKKSSREPFRVPGR
jgi:hypothetical protein